VVKAGSTVKLGVFGVEFIHVNHSIADACCLSITTPLGVVVHSGDFKLDTTPIDGDMMNITRLGEIGRRGVLLLMCESTNAERPGFTPSEKNVGESLKSVFLRHPKKRIVITTFSSNVHRVQQIIDISVAHKRKVAVIGRSMQNIVSAAIELGYMHVPEGAIIDIGDIKNYNPENVTVITTGSQGEPMSALYRMAFSDHAKLNLGNDDLVVISANPIPGNEKFVDKLINEFTKNNVTVFRDSSVEIHVSGHACQGELRLLQALVKPKYFMPVHGEYKHLAANRDIAKSMGQDPSSIFIAENGKVLEISAKSAKFNGNLPCGVLFVDGAGVGDVGNIVLRDRKHLSEEGIIVVVASVSLDEGLLISGPEVITRGFVYMRESEELIAELRRIAYDSIYDALDENCVDWAQLKNIIKDDLSRYIYSKTKRRPMILPVILDV
jgi:ribonuclease J